MTEQHIEREWIFDEILAWWNREAADEPFCLLTGRAGMGKSWIASRFVDDRSDGPDSLRTLRARTLAVYPCRSGYTNLLRFTEHLAERLQALAGARYEEILRSGPGQVTITGNATSDSGTAVGVNIGELRFSSFPGQSGQDFEQRVRRPMIQLARQGVIEKRLVVVDGLEIPQAREPGSIVDQLANSLPTTLATRYLLVFDTVDSVRRTFRPSAHEIDLAGDPRVDDDVRALIAANAARSPVLDENLASRPGLGETIVEKVAGSFKYANALLAELQSRRLAEGERLHVPDEVFEYYLGYLHRLFGGPERWNPVVPAIGPISVSTLGIPRARLEELIDERDRDDPTDAYERLVGIRQFVAGEGSEDDGYRSWDSSFPEFLNLDTVSGEDNPNRVPAAVERRLIVAAYINQYARLAEAVDRNAPDELARAVLADTGALERLSEGLDEYGLRNLSFHLAELSGSTGDAVDYRRLLVELVTHPAYHRRVLGELSDGAPVLGEAHAAALRAKTPGGDETGRIVESCCRSNSAFAVAAAVDYLIVSADDAELRRLASADDDGVRRVVLAAILGRTEHSGADLLVDLVVEWTEDDPELIGAAVLQLSYQWTTTVPSPVDRVYGAALDRLDRIRLRDWITSPRDSLRTAQALVDFVGRVAVLIYTNNCSEEDVVVDQTADLVQRALTEVIPIRRLSGTIARPLLNRVARVAVAGPITTAIDGLNVPDLRGGDRWFGRPSSQGRELEEVIERLDPDRPLESIEGDLLGLLDSDYGIDCVIACVAMGVHSHAHPDSMQRMLRRLFDDADGRARLWLLLSQATLFASPSPRAELVATFTERYVTDNREHFVSNDDGRFDGFEVQLLPLVLTAGLEGRSSGLAALLAAVDDANVEQWVAMLRAAGTYDPGAVFDAIDVAGLLDRAEESTHALLQFLRAAHPLPVDAFIAHRSLEQWVPRTPMRKDLSQHERFRSWIGLFNNAVHQALRYPRMRRRILIDGANALVKAANAGDFAKRYVPGAIDMLNESDYDLRRWTEPE